ncbi:GNAT family N-acetyltransferase [Candidatus Poribacteria bacterium]|nr:GNAT family N-acetyltransferase [Candidatus Poribacteria bacterium]MYG08393.1 GNAT family N-acetyltransferase [Candidatus Poribacteria bacterium]MYK21425.1 GNAT family N-acetyltransferase [Candidatus Poribacteria bacterium]
MEFRALYPDELEAWLDHVTHVFSGGRQYFSNHWHNDPWRDPEGIRIAVDNGTIVSTVRVFIRKMFLHGEPVSVGGIGEVSTRPEYRQRGLATQLLKDSIRFMESRDIVMSSLHGSQRIYSIEGWEKVPRYYAKQSIAAKKQVTWDVRPANFDNHAEVERIAALYDAYARKFNGTFVRDDMAYWTEWVRTESPNAWVAECDGDIEGYVSVVRREARLNVEEFFVSDPVFAEDRGQRLFGDLLSNVIAQIDVESLEVIYPAPIADGFNAPTIEERGSAMYRINQPDALSNASDSIPNLLHNQPQSLAQGIKSHHIFWYTDGY